VATVSVSVCFGVRVCDQCRLWQRRVIRDGRLLPSRMNCGKPERRNSISETRLAGRLALPCRLENECLVAARPRLAGLACEEFVPPISKNSLRSGYVWTEFDPNILIVNLLRQQALKSLLGFIRQRIRLCSSNFGHLVHFLLNIICLDLIP
jgi:hypothetical protein